eukprot:gene2060-2756_t
MSIEGVDKIKRSLFDTALHTIVCTSEVLADKVREYLLEPHDDGSTVADMILADEEEYPSHAGFMIPPLTYRCD